MGTVKRILGAVVAVLAALMLLASLGAAVAVWVVRPRLEAGASKLFARVDAALDVTRRGVGQVNDVLEKSEANLREFRERTPADPAGGDRLRQPALRIAVSKLRSQYSPQELHDNLTAAAEAIVVANTVLESAGESPLNPRADLDADRVRQMSARLTEAGKLTQELSAMVDDEGATATGMRDQASRIEEALTTVHTTTKEYESQIDDIADRVARLKLRIQFWFTAGPVVATVVLLWFAVSQVSLLMHAVSWLRKRAKPAAP
jgi:hypothetical protein